MRDARPFPSRILWLFLFSAAACLASRTAPAQVTGYLVINPIDVCDSSGKNCAPFCSTTINGTSGCPNNPSTATSSTPIGFVDPTTNINITRAIWLQAGIDPVFLPLQQYNSPANQDAWKIAPTYPATDYRTLHVYSVGCSGVNYLTSPDFETLTRVAFCLPNGSPQTGVGKADPP